MDEQEKNKTKKCGTVLLWVGLIAFFVYSYQSIIDIKVFGDEIRQTSIMRVFRALAHPDIIYYEKEELNAEIPFYLPCPEGEIPVLPEIDTSGPYLVASASCGAIREEIIVEGFNMDPFTQGPLIFVTDNGVKKYLGDFLVDEDGYFSVEVKVPNRQPVEEAQAIRATIYTDIGPPLWSDNALATVDKLWETIQMSFLATSLSAIFATLFSFFLLGTSSGKLKVFSIILEPIFAAVRSVHPIITTVPAIIFVGIGPFAGVIALTFFSTAVLTAKYSEYANEHPESKSSVLLQRHFPGIAFKHLPANITIASVIGFWGGGGIGFLLSQNVNLLDYRAASVQLIAIILVVGSLDLFSKFVWRKIRE